MRRPPGLSTRRSSSKFRAPSAGVKCSKKLEANTVPRESFGSGRGSSADCISGCTFSSQCAMRSGFTSSAHFSAASPKWALDVNPDLIAHWEENVQPLIQSALEPLPLPNDSLGTVFASNFFEHFTAADGARILLELRRVLKPGGRLIVVQPNFRLEPRRYFDDYTHQTIYTDEGFSDFLRSLGWKM